MSYTELTLHTLRKKVAAELLAEVNALRAEEGMHPIPAVQVSTSDIEQRVQTMIMAGVGDPANLERKTSPEIATVAAKYMEFGLLVDWVTVSPDEAKEIRSLAASVLSQA